MKIIAINGSPRKNWNTARLLEAALDGARAQGAETKLYHLYDYDFKGCRSCFACKRIGSPFYGKCAQKDGISDILAEVKAADGLVLGTPIYFGAATGEFRSFLERLLFPNYAYDLEKNVALGESDAYGSNLHYGYENDSALSRKLSDYFYDAEKDLWC